jgi:hypothetical protein
MRGSKHLGVLVALIAAAAIAPVAAAAVGVGSLTGSDVASETGASRPAADIARLQAAAEGLAAQGFPTKFAVIAKPVADMDREAARLRQGLARTLGPDAVDAVVVIAPHRVGVNAHVLDCERGLAVQAEAQTVKSDDIQGAINIARRLQAYDQQQALRDANCNEVELKSSGGSGGGKKGLLIVLLVAGVLLIGAIVFFARRASRQSDGATPDGTGTDGGAPPPDAEPETSGSADAPDHDG